MDETEFREMFKNQIPLKCAFYKLILSSRGECKHTRKANLAERDAVGCMNTLGHDKCVHFTQQMSEFAKFALKKTDDAPLTHAQLLKVQQGSLEGIRAESGLSETDILELIVAAEDKYGKIENMPFEQIARAITQVKIRNRKHSK